MSSTEDLGIHVPDHTILSLLGHGGMATVYLARDKEFDRLVAVKIVDARFAIDDQFNRRFEREAKIAGGLSHPHIVPVHRYGLTAEGRPYLTMAYLDGGSLKERMQARGPLPIDEALTIGRQLASALLAAHGRSIIHRDLKPDNVLFQGDTAFLTDFGIAKLLDASSELTIAGHNPGTVKYFSPEQAQEHELDARSDIYTLGVLIYEMLTCSLPIEGDTMVKLIMRLVYTEPAPLPEALRGLQPFMDLMLAKDPRNRFGSCQEVISAIDAILRNWMRSGEADNLMQGVEMRASGLRPVIATDDPEPAPSAAEPSATASDSVTGTDDDPESTIGRLAGTNSSLGVADAAHDSDAASITGTGAEDDDPERTILPAVVRRRADAAPLANVLPAHGHDQGVIAAGRDLPPDRPAESSSEIPPRAVPLPVPVFDAHPDHPPVAILPERGPTDRAAEPVPPDAAPISADDPRRPTDAQATKSPPSRLMLGIAAVAAIALGYWGMKVYNPAPDEPSVSETATIPTPAPQPTPAPADAPKIDAPPATPDLPTDMVSPGSEAGEAEADPTPQQASLATLNISVTPRDARVRLLGTAERFKDGMTLPAGSVTVRIEREGYTMLEETLTLREGANSFDRVLQRATGTPPPTAPGREFVDDSAPEPAPVRPPVRPTGPLVIRRPGEVFKDSLSNGTSGPAMVVVPAGSFRMGGTGRDETPAHNVAIQRPFAVGVYEVTFDEYDQFARSQGRALPPDQGWGRGRRPVINVSWTDAKAYVKWLSAETGMTYRLLSESEWEYASRAGTTSTYSFGDSLVPGRANCDGCGGSVGRQTAVVGSFPANGFGLFDTHGNVWEWVEDCYQPNYSGAPANGRARTGECRERVFRGGSFFFDALSMRSAKRSVFASSSRSRDLGFRVARDL